jgi:hypothetical protein
MPCCDRGHRLFISRTASLVGVRALLVHSG